MTKTAATIAAEIRRAYRLTGNTEWAKMTDVAGLTDLTPEQWKAGMAELLNTDLNLEVMPESNQKTLTATDRLYRVWSGGMENDLMMWL